MLRSTEAWPETHLNQLKSLWREGLSATQIAWQMEKTFGVRRTRSAILGKVHRTGLETRQKPTNEVQLRRRVLARVAKRIAPPKVRSAPLPQLPIDRVAIKELPMLGPNIVDAGPRSCKFIAGDPQHDASTCGRQTESGRVYCADHAKLCYEPAPKKRQAKQKEPVSRTLDQSRWIWGAA